MSQKIQESCLSLFFKNGGFDLRLDGKPMACQLGLQLRGQGWGSHVFRDCPPEAESSQGSDSFGAYEEVTLLSRWAGRESDGMEARKSPAFSAGLRFRYYQGRQIGYCSLIYQGAESLSADGAAKLVIPLLHGFEQGLSAWRNHYWWTAPQFVSSPKQVSSPSQQLLYRRGDGLYGLLLPLGGNGAKASLGAAGGEFGLDLASQAEGFRGAETPLLVFSVAEDPYAMGEAAFELASLAMQGSFQPRRAKSFPAIFEGIGWCSWNTYYYDVDESKLIASARSFAEAKFPIQYMLIDDGWSTLRSQPEKPINPDKPWPGTGSMLWDFKADPAKFPGGLKATKAELTRICGVPDMGVWHAFLGYWSYIHPDSPVATQLEGKLMPSATGGLVPDPRHGKALAFYEAWYSYLKAEGISFLKVDDQSSVQFAYKNLLPLQDAARGLEQALQGAAAPRFGNAVINCMAMSWENVSALDSCNVSRSSNDFLPSVPDNGPQHLACNVYNSFWLSGASTPDFDMFESYHPEGESHALLRSVSGGPIYFTDKPGREDWGLLRKLITADGRLLRADQPALPTRDMLFSDPMEKALPLKAFTKAGPGGAGAVAAFNVFRGHEGIRGSVSSADVEGLAGKDCLLYEHFSGKALLLKAGAALSFELEPGGKQLFLLSPIEDGFAALGLLDKFSSLKAVESVQRQEAEIRVQLREAGRFGFFCQREVLSVRMAGLDVDFYPEASGFCQVSPASPPQGTCEVVITLKAQP